MFDFLNRYVGSKEMMSDAPFKIVRELQEQGDAPLDFRILSFETVCKNDKITRILSSKELRDFYDDSYFVTAYKYIKQNFKIEIFDQKLKAPRAYKIRLEYNGDKTILRARVAYDENLSYDERLFEDLLQDMLKLMIERGFLVGIRVNPQLKQEISNFTSSVQNKQMDSKEVVINIARGVKMVQSQSEYTSFKLDNLDEKDKFNAQFDEKNFVTPIEKDTLLFEYYKSKQGVPGRNLQGVILEPNPLEGSDNPIQVGENIYTKEDKDKISYFSKIYGYLQKTHEIYNITNKLMLDKVEVKNSGSFRSNLKEDIAVKVVNNNAIDEGVKSGVKIEAKDIDVLGNVSDALLKAMNLYIEGSTHLQTDIEAKQVYVGTLRGKLQGETVFINNLERAEVKADNVVVANTCLGSTIRANRIYIKNVLANNKFYPSECLVFDQISKDNNLIEVSPSHSLNFHEEYVKFSSLDKQLGDKIAYLTQNMGYIYRNIVKNQNSVFAIKEQLDQADQSKINTSSYKKMLEFYEGHIKKYDELMKYYDDTLNLSFFVKKRLESFHELPFQVKLIIGSNLGQDNIIRFISMKPRQAELQYALKQNDPSKTFSLKRDSNYAYISRENKIDEADVQWVQEFEKKARGKK